MFGSKGGIIYVEVFKCVKYKVKKKKKKNICGYKGIEFVDNECEVYNKLFVLLFWLDKE